jgi:hypothetical protein
MKNIDRIITTVGIVVLALITFVFYYPLYKEWFLSELIKNGKWYFAIPHFIMFFMAAVKFIGETIFSPFRKQLYPLMHPEMKHKKDGSKYL